MAESFATVYLQSDEIHFERAGDTLRLSLQDGREFPRVIVRRCFPVSQGPILLSVRDAASEDQDEIGIIENWEALKPADQTAVAEELNLHYFVPRVSRVRKVKQEFGFLYWTVDTDKGDREFTMRDNVIHYAREVGDNHWLLIDVNGARYEIRNLLDLDSRSQKLVRGALRL